MNKSKVWRRVAATNDASSAFSGPAATETQPSTNVLAPIEGNTLEVIPFGVGSNDTTFDMRLVGWTKVDALWVPRILARLSCTLSTAVGVAGSGVLNTERFADTISTQEGIVVIASAAANTPLSAIIPLGQHQLFTVEFDMTGATSGNALWKAY